jgi:hypothetical protein
MQFGPHLEPKLLYSSRVLHEEILSPVNSYPSRIRYLRKMRGFVYIATPPKSLWNANPIPIRLTTNPLINAKI